MMPPTSTTTTQVRRRRFIRQPEKAGNKQINDTSFRILAIIERYQFIPTSLLVRLAGGNERNNHRHLRTLFDLGYTNRFALPTVYGTPGEYVYYLDSRETLRQLIERGLINATEDARERKENAIRLHQQKAYDKLHRDPDQQGKLLYIQHELMISRFHAVLELACQKFAGKVQLEQWAQGPELYNRVEVPELFDDGRHQDMSKMAELAHYPDAFFTLFFPGSPPEKQRSHFLYEADRKTERTRRFKLKLRAHWHFIVKRQLQRTTPPYNLHSFRAVLIESIGTKWADTLRRAAQEPIVSPKPSPLFWFTASEAFANLVPAGARPRPRYLLEPETIFKRIWFSPVSEQPLSLLD